MTLAEIHDWFDGFHDHIIEGKVKIRNRIFSGAHLEIFDRNRVLIVMEQGMNVAPDASDEQRAVALVKQIFIDDRNLLCEIPTDRFEKIVRGEDTIKDEEWFWSDEDSPLDS